jgi:hypothetical protein
MCRKNWHPSSKNKKRKEKKGTEGLRNKKLK